MVLGIVILAIVVGLIVYGSTREGKSELEVILTDLSSTVNQLETFADNRGLEIADHLEEIALHRKHVDVKGAEVERARRIRDKLNELLA